MRAWPALAVTLAVLGAACLLPAWAQTPPPAHKQAKKPVPVKAQKAHRKATPEQIRRFNQLQRKGDRR